MQWITVVIDTVTSMALLHIFTIDLANDSSVQQLVDLLMFMRRRPVELVLVHGNAGSQNG